MNPLDHAKIATILGAEIVPPSEMTPRESMFAFHAAELQRQCTRLDAEDDAASSAWANDPGWNLIPEGESPWDSCEQCRGVFHSSQIRPTDATLSHMHLCPSCTKLRWTARRLRDAIYTHDHTADDVIEAAIEVLEAIESGEKK